MLVGKLIIISNEQGAAAKPAADKTAKYQELEKTKTYIFFAVAIETPSSWSQYRPQNWRRRLGDASRPSLRTGLTEKQPSFLRVVRGSAKGKCGLILRHFSVRLIRH